MKVTCGEDLWDSSLVRVLIYASNDFMGRCLQ